MGAKQPVIRLMRPWQQVESVDSEKLRRRENENGARYRERKEREPAARAATDRGTEERGRQRLFIV
jgi:hypothetical protein